MPKFVRSDMGKLEASKLICDQVSSIRIPRTGGSIGARGHPPGRDLAAMSRGPSGKVPEPRPGLRNFRGAGIDPIRRSARKLSEIGQNADCSLSRPVIPPGPADRPYRALQCFRPPRRWIRERPLLIYSAKPGGMGSSATLHSRQQIRAKALRPQEGGAGGNVKSYVLSNSGFRVNSSGLAAAGYRVVYEVFAGALAGLLHDGALWLRPPRVRERIVGGLNHLATHNAGSPRPTSRRGRAFPLVRNYIVSLRSLPSSTRSVLSLTPSGPLGPASGTARQ